jgi:hypothetical protein
MNRDDIIAMAQEAIITHSNPNPFDFRFTTVEQLECFAALVAAAEREACAKVCEDARSLPDVGPLYCAVAIRARGHVNEQAKSLTRSDDMLKESGIKWEVEP